MHRTRHIRNCFVTRNAWIPILLLSMMFTHCRHNDEDLLMENPVEKCIAMVQNAEWPVIPFKYSYTIQVPVDYEGPGAAGFEGWIFLKYRTDQKIQIKYAFCGPLFCYNFGKPLEMPIPDSLLARDKNSKEIVLRYKREYCMNDTTFGYFYYNKEPGATGVFFQKQDEDFLESVSAFYEITEFQEVEDILKTIAAK